MSPIDHWRDLEKCQACSHPDLANRKPEELFEPGFADRYRRLHKNLWGRIIRVDGTLYTLGQLKEFPFDYLYSLNQMEFWRLVISNFLDTACLMLHALTNDTGKDVHSIRRFKNEILEARWLDQAKCSLLKQTLAERKFDNQVEDIAKRVTQIRNQRIAHRLYDTERGGFSKELAGVSLDELRQLFDVVKGMFGAISFGSAYATRAGDLMPGTVAGKPTRTCLDEVLDAVLRNSHFVNMPERDGQRWGVTRQYRDDEELKVMNDLRKRIGLPEA